MKYFASLAGFLVLMMPMLTSAAAGNPDSDVSGRCRAEMIEALGHDNRLYRSVVFGEVSAKDSAIFSSKYDTTGNAWVKSGTDRWTNTDQGTWSDAQMDAHAELRPRQSVFATRRALTSELIPALTQNYRGFSCLLSTTCQSVGMNTATAKSNATKTDPDMMNVQVAGCAPLDIPRLPDCEKLADSGDSTLNLSVNACQPLSEMILSREADILKMTVQYDAAYRSLLQFSGVFDDFTDQFQGDLLTPIQETAALAGQLSRIPCFLAECNE